jgi:hypothetical protein
MAALRYCALHPTRKAEAQKEMLKIGQNLEESKLKC